MTLGVVKLGYEYFPDPTRGRPVFFGSIFVGNPDTDPEIPLNQKQLTIRQEDGTEIEVSQPINTGSGGVPLFNGSPVQLLVIGDYSLKVLNSSGSQVFYLADSQADEVTQWILLSPATFVSTTSYTVNNDVTANYVAGRRVQLNNGGLVEGEVVSSVFNDPLTTVTVSMDGGFALTNSLSSSSLSIISDIRGVQPIGAFYPRTQTDGASRPIIEADLGGSSIRLWAHFSSQNMFLTNGGTNLNNAVSGSKDGSNNTAFGFGNFTPATTSFACAAFGYNALNALTTGDSNTALGYQALIRCTTGINNTAAGVDAGFSVTTGNDNTLIGRHVIFEGTGSTDFTGSNNVMIGVDMALNATTIEDSIFIGKNTQIDGLTSVRSIAIGTAAAQVCPAVSDSIIMGRQTAQNSTTLVNCVHIGNRVNERTLSDTGSVNVGDRSFFILGAVAQINQFNTSLGSNSGLQVYGTNNTFLGYRSAAYAADTEINGAIAIGFRAGDAWIGDNDFVVSNSQVQANSLIYGNFSSRVMELEATRLKLRNIPTASAGLVSGEIWNNAGVLNIIP